MFTSNAGDEENSQKIMQSFTLQLMTLSLAFMLLFCYKMPALYKVFF